MPLSLLNRLYYHSFKYLLIPRQRVYRCSYALNFLKCFLKLIFREKRRGKEKIGWLPLAHPYWACALPWYGRAGLLVHEMTLSPLIHTNWAFFLLTVKQWCSCGHFNVFFANCLLISFKAHIVWGPIYFSSLFHKAVVRIRWRIYLYILETYKAIHKCADVVCDLIGWGPVRTGTCRQKG